MRPAKTGKTRTPSRGPFKTGNTTDNTTDNWQHYRQHMTVSVQNTNTAIPTTGNRHRTVAPGCHVVRLCAGAPTSCLAAAVHSSLCPHAKWGSALHTEHCCMACDGHTSASTMRANPFTHQACTSRQVVLLAGLDAGHNKAETAVQLVPHAQPQNPASGVHTCVHVCYPHTIYTAQALTAAHHMCLPNPKPATGVHTCVCMCAWLALQQTLVCQPAGLRCSTINESSALARPATFKTHVQVQEGACTCT